jgi:hypothetical protein
MGLPGLHVIRFGSPYEVAESDKSCIYKWSVAVWLELTSEEGEKIYVNLDQVIIIYPVDEDKHTRILTSGGAIRIKEPLAYIQSKVEI